METSVVTPKGQVLIPKRLRAKYGIQSGVKVAFIEVKDGLMLKAMDEAYFDQYAGLLKDAAPSTAELKAWKGEERRREEHQAEKKYAPPAKKKR